MKKRTLLTSNQKLITDNKIIGLLLFLLTISFARAGPVQGVDQLLTGLGDIIVLLIEFISDLILNINTFDEFLFAKLILFSLILLVVYTVISNNNVFSGAGKTIQWIISSAISILAVRYLPDNFIQAILLQYGALAVGLTVFLPLSIYFFFIHQSGVGPFGRRVGWVVFATAFFALWSFRYEDLGVANWMYWIAIGFIIISAIFDKKIHEYFGMKELRESMSAGKIERRVRAQKSLEAVEENHDQGHITDKEYDKLKAKYQKIIKRNL